MKMLAVVIDGTANIPGQTDTAIPVDEIHENDRWMYSHNVATNALLIWRWLVGENINPTISTTYHKYRFYGNINKISIPTITGEAIYFNGVGSSGQGRSLQKLFGTGTTSRIRDAYRFIAERYEPRTKLSIFGFSRGAYAARSLAGLINHVGLPRNRRLLPEPVIDELFESYRSSSPYLGALKDQFEAVDIDFIGVFDTVGSLALEQTANSFHEISPANVHCFRHALALDERRRTFTPDFYNPRSRSFYNIKEVWFAGAHSNIGGGYNLPKLSSITLIWMMREFINYFDKTIANPAEHPLAPQEAMNLNSEKKINKGRVKPSKNSTIKLDRKQERSASYIRDSYDELLGVTGKFVDLAIGKGYRSVPEEFWHTFHPSVYEWLCKGDYIPIAKTKDGENISKEIVLRRLCTAEDWPITDLGSTLSPSATPPEPHSPPAEQ